MHSPVHPRWRGEHATLAAMAIRRRGSSPLARGTLFHAIARRPRSRFIPAGAGNTSTQACRMRANPVHPRWRGEHSSGEGETPAGAGSSPLARGTPSGRRSWPYPIRFIPAGAGNTLRRCRLASEPAVHPRWRGEHQVSGGGRRCGSRFIPAGAGNTRRPLPDTRPVPVHPRWRGEHELQICPVSISTGSSPLARGTLRGAGGRLAVFRFIPAGAGNTRPRCSARLEPSVHPRWRGEHPALLLVSDAHHGSSPLARGTRYKGFMEDHGRRFIPAGAGNTPLGSDPALDVTVHPRWRGEHRRV